MAALPVLLTKCDAWGVVRYMNRGTARFPVVFWNFS